MTPGARIRAAIEIQTALEAPDAPPMDQYLAGWARRNRYAGSGDRTAISAILYGIARRRAQLDWWLDRTGIEAAARMRVLAFLVLGQAETAETVEAACAEGRYRPDPLRPDEREALRRLAGEALDSDDQPGPVRANLPAWLHNRLAAAFGAGGAAEFAALMEEAPVDLRINTLAGTPDRAAAGLAADGIETEPGAFSPLALRLKGRRPLGGTAAFKAGLVEVQDEGSQLVAALCDARPGMRVLDLCAGAGGKTLALAAAMENRGHILACDVAAKRLNQATARLRRAGVHIAERRVIGGAEDATLADERGGFDRVLVDAPCSGTGTLRRRPDLRWTLTTEAVDRDVETQARLLRAAAPLVAPGGRLIYATCSLLEEENEARMTDFLAAQPQFHAVPVETVWADTVGGDSPGAGDSLRLTPARHRTDGFFVAVLERRL